MGTITIERAQVMCVGAWLKEHGYVLASEGIEVEKTLGTGSIDIIMPDVILVPERRYLFGLIRFRPRRLWLGTLRFGGGPEGLLGEDWTLEFSGVKQQHAAHLLASLLAQDFGVTVSPKLKDYDPAREYFKGEIASGQEDN
jgi:hypothetical protein